MKVGIVEVGYGNIPSLKRACTNSGFEAHKVDTPESLSEIDRLILPGVGAFPGAMKSLRESGLLEAIKFFVEVQHKPILGICLGAQLLFESSEEEIYTAGMGLLEGRVRHLQTASFPAKIPHTGWSETRFVRRFGVFHEGAKVPFYYNHSFFFTCDSNQVICELETSNRIATGVSRDNILAFQFHPEKSLDQGFGALMEFFGDCVV